MAEASVRQSSYHMVSSHHLQSSYQFYFSLQLWLRTGKMWYIAFSFSFFYSGDCMLCQECICQSQCHIYIKDITESYCTLNCFSLPLSLLAKVITSHVNQIWKRVFSLEAELQSEFQGSAVRESWYNLFLSFLLTDKVNSAPLCGQIAFSPVRVAVAFVLFLI